MFQSYRNLFRALICFSGIFMLIACGGSGGSDESAQPSQPSVPAPDPAQRIWTVDEILSEPRSGGFGGEARCGGELGFRRCVCTENVPGSLRYRPAVVECNGNAAAILSDQYLDAFSIVVRDSQNRDRWPAAGSGFGGCSFELANSESPPNSCSAFKVQSRFPVGGGTAVVHCFGASGYSDIFSDVTRVTIKNSDDPFSSDDDIDRLCLVSGSRPLN